MDMESVNRSRAVDPWAALRRRLASLPRPRREWFLVTPWSALGNPFYIIRRGLLKSITRMAPAVQGDVLDFGCGSKPYESLFRHARRYVGVDIEVSGHDHRDSKVDVFYDGSTLPFADGQFDAVVAFEVFEHVFNLDEVLGEVRRVLKPQGRLLLSIPFAWEEHEKPYDFARYTSDGLRHLLERNGFTVVELARTTSYLLAVFQLLIAYLVQHVLPRGRLLGGLCQLTVVFPITALALALDAVLPRRDQLFSNLVVLAERRAQ